MPIDLKKTAQHLAVLEKAAADPKMTTDVRFREIMSGSLHDLVVLAATDVRDLLADREGLLALLRKVEWVPRRTGGGHGDPEREERFCLFCGRRPPGGAQVRVGTQWVDAPECGHAPDCLLDAALGGAPPR